MQHSWHLEVTAIQSDPSNFISRSYLRRLMANGWIVSLLTPSACFQDYFTEFHA